MDIKDTLTGGLLSFENNFKKIDIEVKKEVAMELLKFTNHGSPYDSTIPPEKEAILKGSASVFIGDIYVGADSAFPNREHTNISGSGETDKDLIVIGYNAPYSARMHEHKGNWGIISMAAGDVGNRWVTKHLAADGPSLVIQYGQRLKQKLGM